MTYNIMAGLCCQKQVFELRGRAASDDNLEGLAQPFARFGFRLVGAAIATVHAFLTAVLGAAVRCPYARGTAKLRSKKLTPQRRTAIATRAGEARAEILSVKDL